MKAALLAVVLAGCSSLDAGAQPGADGGGLSDAAPMGCEVSIQFTPQNPEAGDHVHAAAIFTGFDGVPAYAWTLDGSASMAFEALDHSAIGFDVPTPATHEVLVDVSGGSTGCPQGTATLVVAAAGSASTLYRLRVLPPSDVAPPFETEMLVHGGTPTLRDVQLDPGEPMSGTITSATMGGVPAYVQLVPAIGPPIEAFSALGTGAFSARVALAPYQVVVVPELSGLAPRAFAWAPGDSFDFAVDAGSTIAGTVSAPGGGPLAGATVQLTSGGVPSTVATTLGDGTFTLLASFAPNAQVTATVVPPATSGLARLTASLNLAASLAITYNPATPCDLGGASVQRGGVAKPGAQVTIVGSTGTAGAIGGVAAAGSVVATATANGSGVLPSLPIPNASGLSAVVQIAAGDLAVVPVTCATSPIVAPAPVASSGIVVGATGSPIAGVQVEAVPIGALALATLAPVASTTGADGSVTLPLASGASYALRVVDPDARAAPLFASSVTALPATMTLGAALAVSGTVSVIGGTNAVAGAAVELLCAACTGLDAERPIAQTATDVQGDYALAVPDPGSM